MSSSLQTRGGAEGPRGEAKASLSGPAPTAHPPQPWGLCLPRLVGMKGWDFRNLWDVWERESPCLRQSALLPGSKPEAWSPGNSACTFLSCICEMGLGLELGGLMHADGRGRRCCSLRRAPLFLTSWTVVHQAPLSMGFSQKEYWSLLSFASSRDLPNPGIEPVSPALAGRFFKR